MTVYLDKVFALNFCVNYLLLWGTARLGASALRRGRFLLAAGAGAFYAVAVYLPGFGFLQLCRLQGQSRPFLQLLLMPYLPLLINQFLHHHFLLHLVFLMP